MASAKPVSFDADKNVETRNKGAVIIGGKTFHPRKKNGKLMKDLIGLGPDEQPKDEDLTKAQSQANIDMLYKQIDMLLVDEEGEAPGEEFLMEELDFDDCQELVAKLMPSRDEREAGKEGRNA